MRVQENDRVDEKRVRSRLRVEQGDVFDAEKLHGDLAYVYGFGDFQSVTYRLLPDDTDYRLELLCQEKPWGPSYVHFGLRLESDVSGNTSWSGLLNLNRLSVNDLGGEWEIDLEFGTDRKILLEWYQPLDYSGHYFVSPRISYGNELQGVYDEGDRTANYELEQFDVGLDLGVQYGAHAELRVGPYWRGVEGTVETGSADIPSTRDGLGGFRAQFIIDRLDDAVFSTKGYYIALRGEVAPEWMGSEETLGRGAIAVSHFTTVGKHTGNIQLSGGSGFGHDLPEHAEYASGREFVLAGMGEGQLRGDSFAVASLGYRDQLGKLAPSLGEGVHVGIKVDAGAVWEEGDEVSARDLSLGSGIGLGADTILGPVFISYGNAESGHSLLTFSLGSVF